jgi:hypothetical protein
MSIQKHSSLENRLSTTSAVEKLKKLEAEANELRSEAKKEAMAAVKAALADLNGLGFKYRLMEGDGGGSIPTPFKKAKKGKSGITRHRDPNKPCDVCGFATDPGHDARKHRAQGENKKAFTAKELEERGLKKK